MPGANDNLATVAGRVRDLPDGCRVVEIDPVTVGADGRAEFLVEFDRPLEIPLEALIPDADSRREMAEGLDRVASMESGRMDDLAEALGLDPAKDFRHLNLSDAEMVGEPGRPLDLRGWDFTGSDLSRARFEHVIVDGTTVFDRATLDDIGGSDAEAVLNLVAARIARP